MCCAGLQRTGGNGQTMGMEAEVHGVDVAVAGASGNPVIAAKWRVQLELPAW